MTMKKFLKEMLSEAGSNGQFYVSSKRVVGFIITMVSLGCIIYLTIKDGGTVVVENLIQTAFIMGTSLLGISSVTSIWKHGSISVGENKESVEPSNKKPKRKINPCDDCEFNTEKDLE